MVLLGLLMFGLPACSLLEVQSGDGGTAATQSQPTQRAISVEPAAPESQLVIPELQATDSAEQQAIIAEINRDGQQTPYSGFREEVPAPEVPEDVDVVELNYEQADLRLVLEELADALDITMVIDPSIDTRISIRTSTERPLQQDDIWPLIRLLTRDAGIVLEKVGDVYNARRVASNIPVEIATPDTLGDGTAAQIMQGTRYTRWPQPRHLYAAKSRFHCIAPIHVVTKKRRTTEDTRIAAPRSFSGRRIFASPIEIV